MVTFEKLQKKYGLLDKLSTVLYMLASMSWVPLFN